MSRSDLINTMNRFVPGARSGALVTPVRPLAQPTSRISTSQSTPEGFGQRLTHSIASSLDSTSQSQKPASSSLVSANGPSMTDVLPPENRTRTPFELGCKPSPASITPALTSSSL